METLQEYTYGLKCTLDLLPWQAIQQTVNALHNARRCGHQVLVAGNGGSAATASHLACDLGKNLEGYHHPRMRIRALNDNMAIFSAYANDNGYASVFYEQLVGVLTKDDIFLAISTSGNSPNIVQALEHAKQIGALTIGCFGSDGGKAVALADIPVLIPNTCIEQIEDVHLILVHMLKFALDQMAAEENALHAVQTAFSVTAPATRTESVTIAQIHHTHRQLTP